MLDPYVDRAVVARSIAALELMIELLGAAEPLRNGEWEWAPATSLEHSVAPALSDPRRTLTTFLPWCRGIARSAIVSFTADN